MTEGVDPVISIVMVVLPVVAGTAILTLCFLPMPSTLAFVRLAEGLFWVFGAAGVLMSRNGQPTNNFTWVGPTRWPLRRR